MTHITVHAPTPEALLEEITAMGITLNQLEAVDPFTLRFRVSGGEGRIVAKYFESKHLKYSLVKTGGFYPGILLRRPVLLAGVAIVIFLSLFLPTRVLFVRVEGNTTVPLNRILEAAAEEGICFGVSRRQIRSEEVKNALLEKIPDLRWVGVNTQGCVAILHVEESAQHNATSRDTHITSIVAATDGFVLSATATGGKLLCEPGQTVTKGQVLISPYRDCGICILAERAQGEVVAQTHRQITAISPNQATRRLSATDTQVNFSLILGKKRINLWKGSGIFPGVCVRMYEEYYITLPGGLVLPIAIGKQTVYTYRVSDSSLPMTEEEIASYARSRMLDATVAGSVIRENLRFQKTDDGVYFSGNYLCVEMIGRERSEQIGDNHGKND